MTTLTIALIAFVGTHFLMSHPLRAPMVRALGAATFQIVYTLVSFATLGWAVFAFRAIPPQLPQWQAGEGSYLAATVIMLVASILLVGSFLGNPALPQPNAKALAAQPARGIFATTRHPMMWSFALWSLAHLLVSPRPAVIVLTLAIAILALGGAAGQDAKKRKLMGDSWRDWASRTTFFPVPRGWPGLVPVVGGIVLWLIATWAHPMLGAPVAGIWAWL